LIVTKARYLWDGTLNRFLLSRRYPAAGLARPINRFENFLIPCAELEIGKTVLISPDRLDQIVHLEYLHIEIAQPATGEVKTKESRILRDLRSAEDRGETPVALCFSHSKDLKLIEPFAVVYQSALRTADLPKDTENAPGTDPGSLDDTCGTGGKSHQRLDLIFVFDRPFSGG
jgi:hypothetical protein